MLYWLLQVGALLLLAYFLGALLGCLLRRLFAADQPISARDVGLATAGAAATVAVPEILRKVERVSEPRRPAVVPAPPVVSDPVAEAYEADVAIDVEDDEDEAVAAIADEPVQQPVRPVVPVATVTPAVARAGADDLKRIRGIGPDIEEQLHERGVWRFEEIAAWKADDVRSFDREMEFRGRISREGWIEQAQILARGGSTAFSRRIDTGEVGNIMRAAWSTTAAARSLDDLVVAAPGPEAGDELPDDVVIQRQAETTARLTQDRLERDRLAQLSLENERLERERSEAERLQREASEAEARENAERDQRATAEQDRLQREAAAAERERLQREASEHAERERQAREQEAAERTERERLLQERATREQAAREQAEREALEQTRREAEERQRKAREIELAARAERDRIERDALARQDLERAAAAAAATALATGVLGAGSKSAKAETTVETNIKPRTEVEQDDLKRIRAIDAGLERALHELGINRYEQIAALGPDDVDAVNAHIGNDGRVEREGWIEQAQVLAKGVETSYARRLRENNERSARAARAQQASAGPVAGAAVAGVKTGGSPARGYGDTSALRSVRSERLVGDRREDTRSADERGGRVLRSAQPDDLKRIRGVGVVIEKKLFALGVTAYTQIASWSTDDVAKFSEQLAFSGRIEREGWIEQAKVLARGGETAFSRRVDRGEVDTSRGGS